LGAVPVASCSASDDLSGVDGSCTGTLTGGTSTGVGEFTYEVTAQDKAGNERQKSITYNVEYRFDGFLPPVNDPVFTKWDFKSVLRSGWPVPALFQVKKADGSLVQPGSAPEWLTPQKGKAINAPVNEEQPEESPTSGKTYVKILGVWTYVWNTRGVERGYEYRLGVKLDDGTKHYVVVAVK
ncbi:MAG: PxKF domain-containing protein, partial [Anaerolineae bacterium]|nr:PxKF domain-containing protein [Anaerolineae bacterium]